MSVSPVGQKNTWSSNTSNATLSVPTGVVVGDLLIAQIATDSGAIPSAAGWTLLRHDVDNGYPYLVHAVLYRIAGSSEPASYTFQFSTTVQNGWAGGMIAYRVAKIGNHAASIYTSANPIAPAVSAKSGDYVLRLFGTDDRPEGLYPSGTTGLYYMGGYNKVGVSAGHSVQAASGSSGTSSLAWSGYPTVAVTIEITSLNTPPNAPTLTGPPNDATLDRGVPNVFALEASDPDQGDSTSQTYWRTRIRDIGAAWKMVTRISPVTTYEFAADYFAAGDYEWQAATRDAAGTPEDEADLVWSTSSFFTAADAPPAPIFTAPVNGAVIGQSSFEAVISAPDLVASEWRTVADDGAGNADPTTVYSPSVVLTTGDLRRHTFNFPANNRTEHLQARIKNAEGLWSQWADSRNPISYTPPASPVAALSVDNADGALIVSITNPAPGAGEPAASYNSVRIDDGDGKGLKHRVGSQMLALNTPYTYRLAVTTRDYTGHVEVTTTAENGTTSTTTA